MCYHAEVRKYLNGLRTSDLERCTVGGHDPACIRCPDCHSWIKINLVAEDFDNEPTN